MEQSSWKERKADLIDMMQEVIAHARINEEEPQIMREGFERLLEDVRAAKGHKAIDKAADRVKAFTQSCARSDSVTEH